MTLKQTANLRRFHPPGLQRWSVRAANPEAALARGVTSGFMRGGWEEKKTSKNYDPKYDRYEMNMNMMIDVCSPDQRHCPKEKEKKKKRLT